MKNERIENNIERIYETDAYQTSFTATVVSLSRDVSGKFLAELNRTAFFPEGGGQAGDRGRIEDFAVEDVQKIDGKVVHILDVPVHLEEAVKERLAPGREVPGEVDFALRFHRMQNHLAEHLFCGIAHSRFGYDNVGFHLSDVVTFDLDGALTKEEILSIEKKCNEVVWENVPVKVHFPSAEEVEKMEFRSKLELSEGVRLVEIEGYDMCACCAPALHTTSEIGVIKVVDFMPHRGGTRLTLIAGRDAYEDYVRLDEEQRKLMKLFSAKREEVAKFAEDYAAKTNAMHTEILELKKEITGLYVEKIKRIIEDKTAGLLPGNDPAICFFMKDADEVMVRNVINECLKTYNGILCGFRGNDKEGYRYVCGRKEADEKESLCDYAKAIKDALGGRGGGSEVMIQGSVEATEKKIREFFDEN